MKLRQVVVTVWAFLVMNAGPTFAQSNDKEVEAVRTADAAWMKVYHAKDLDKSLSFLDEQGSMLVSNAPIATGKAALAKAIAQDFAGGTLTWHGNKAGVARSGDLAYTSGTYEWILSDSSGKTATDKGKYLTVWKKEADGSWKVLYDMFNSDLPAR
jgi:ketosteroid isomerase-like protein